MSPDVALPGFPAQVPERLRERVVSLLHAAGETDTVTADHLLRVAAQAIRGVLDAPAGDRAAALDVLAADALVTSALELLAADPEEFEARCDRSLRALTTIATPRD